MGEQLCLLFGSPEATLFWGWLYTVAQNGAGGPWDTQKNRRCPGCLCTSPQPMVKYKVAGFAKSTTEEIANERTTTPVTAIHGQHLRIGANRRHPDFYLRSQSGTAGAWTGWRPEACAAIHCHGSSGSLWPRFRLERNPGRSRVWS